MVAASKPVGGFEASTSTSASSSSSSSSQMPASTVGSGSGSGYRMLDTETVRLVTLLGLFVP